MYFVCSFAQWCILNLLQCKGRCRVLFEQCGSAMYHNMQKNERNKRSTLSSDSISCCGRRFIEEHDSVAMSSVGVAMLEWAAVAAILTLHWFTSSTLFPVGAVVPHVYYMTCLLGASSIFSLTSPFSSYFPLQSNFLLRRICQAGFL